MKQKNCFTHAQKRNHKGKIFIIFFSVKMKYSECFAIKRRIFRENVTIKLFLKLKGNVTYHHLFDSLIIQFMNVHFGKWLCVILRRENQKNNRGLEGIFFCLSVWRVLYGKRVEWWQFLMFCTKKCKIKRISTEKLIWKWNYWPFGSLIVEIISI